MENLEDLKRTLNETEFGLEYEEHDKGTSKCFTFRTSQYAPTVLKYFKEFQENGIFCDVSLKSGINTNKIIRAHKLVLAAASPYFRAMFAGGFRENVGTSEIILDQISFGTLETIVNFIYTSHVNICEANVQNLLPAAKMLQMEQIVSACCIYLFKNMTADNCIGIEEFARSYGCIELSRQAQKFMNDHFCELVESEEFLQFSEHQLCKLLSQDELRVKCESYVFRAIVDWVKHDPEKRRSGLDHLFQCVRFHFLPPKFLKDQMKNNDFLKLKDAEKSRQYMQQVCDELIAHKPCLNVVPRKPSLEFGLYVIGGYIKHSINLVECFRSSKLTWERCTDMPVPRSGISVVSLAFYIFVIGGRNNSLQGNVDCADVDCYDPFMNYWKKCSSMSVPRSRAGAGVIDGQIYACGGAYLTRFHSSVERYNHQDNAWDPSVCSMMIPRIGLGCAVVNRLLYAIGGYDGKSRLNSVECYNPDQNTWNFVAPLQVARSGAGVCAMENFIYVVGGYTTNLQLNSAERYDTLTNQWTFIAPMKTARSALACVTWYRKIGALGGYNGSEFLATTEIYDPVEDKWTDQINLTSERSGHGAVVSVEFVK